MSQYQLHMYDVTYTVNRTDKERKRAHYNVSAPSKGVANEEIMRVFGEHHNMEFNITQSIPVHCAIQVVRWGLGSNE